MDKQKVVKKQVFNFPLVDAMLLTPEQGTQGTIGICSNTTAAGQVLNEIKESLRQHICAIGSLIVSRDGTERMIINSLAHPTLQFLVLFSEESTTFNPSTNLLLALMNGFDTKKKGNYIQQGISASAHYPNISKKIFEQFKKEILVLPIFTSKHSQTKKIISQYLTWLKPKVSLETYQLLYSLNEKEKKYYDVLQKLILHLSQKTIPKKSVIFLDPKEFQHLQPPKLFLPPSLQSIRVPFRVEKEKDQIHLTVLIEGNIYSLKGNDSFFMAYSFMKFLGSQKKHLSFLEQILLGMELGRLETELVNHVPFASYVQPTTLQATEQIPLESSYHLVTDKKYYYKISRKEENVSVMCLAFDRCETVFELISSDPLSIAFWLAEKNRFETYEMDILHRVDVGIQLGRANIAAKRNYSFIQDFNTLFQINTKTLPLIIAEGDSFLAVHKQLLRGIYTKGITEEHADPWKGLARTACTLAIFRNAFKTLEAMPVLYRQGDQDPNILRENYKKELLRFDHDGTYSYGERTRAYFGFDQLEQVISVLKKNPSKAALVQRFDPKKDMAEYEDPQTKEKKFTHDPCLTHDIFFLQKNILHSFHIARAHNAVNAYPENIFGLFDAYVTQICQALQKKSGDLYMLSSRANILLLTEEQRTKTILAEVSKPLGDNMMDSGPCNIEQGRKKPEKQGGVAYANEPLQEIYSRPSHPTLNVLESYKGTNTVTKGIEYLLHKGTNHNNVVLSEYIPGQSDQQADQLAFFQMNIFGEKIYATMVWMNRSLKKKEEDRELANYLATLLKKSLKQKVDMGDLCLFYTAYSL